MSDVPPKVVVVVPTYNERENLPVLVAQLEALRVPNLHVLVVDDNSPDGTGDIADKMVVESDNVHSVLHRTEKNGLGRAYVAGITQALAEGADIVVQMDADLSHPADVIPLMLKTLQDPQTAVVIGSRYVEGGSVASEWSGRRKALSAFANSYVDAILRLKVKDVTAGFKAWKAQTLRDIEVSTIQSDGYAFQVEMNYRTIKHGLKIVEVPINFEERAKGSSKMDFSVQVESALMPWKLRFGKH
ncbi:dolichol-phosphate mannosyltransferase [Jatrophihabitans sp. GAS493]|uniref:polyprenol monophosphomannose synthase n=1 Tax=Jatrophihabitans sp. GAS493 TaxID=1907575 RepID=UPI000BB9A236|nr:polyprenol monophosphomannose synthase [Jatrophihabitans sp. GAS493]SOD71211.1 dolichol-phosphate mannosyltransferase [Jatrophihabitans sp. GAS493]